MNQGERITELRKSLGIKQGDFAKKISTTQGHISDIENGRKNLTDRTIHIICSAFRVNRIWLETGEGDMYLSSDADLLAMVDDLLDGENEFAKSVFKAFTKFSDEEWKMMHKFCENVISGMKKEPQE